jgi:NlpC/P60 family
MQRSKMSIAVIVVAGAAAAASTVAATSAEASPLVTHAATARVPGVVGDAQATANGKITRAGFRPKTSKATHPVRGEALYQFHAESHAQAQPGDLVFFHATSNLHSHVYHVGVFEGGHDMVAATHTGSDVQFQSYLWGGNTVSFGTISH